MTRRLILGTAGHIDHGKTALVRALTGVDTDRLPEEKRRGITIDLGFADLTLDGGVQLGIVDVPGHEAFVRNMLAGATGIDLVLLVVAADEGVMPQTREHLAIVELLGVRAGVVAVTKVDTVDDDWLDLVLDDVRGGLAGSPFAGAEVVPVSAVTGAGLDALQAALARAAAGTGGRSREDLFRMPADRVFSVRGTGTVVTGTVWSGSIARDTVVRILPDGETARVRAVQVHGRETDEAGAGQRAAIALAGIDRASIRRGDVLVADDVWQPHSMVTARIRVLADTGWRVRHRQRVRFHLGAAEVLGRVVLLAGSEDAASSPAELAPGDEAWVQLRLEAPVVARAGDRFVIRSYSPMTTIGGGVIVEPAAPKRKRVSAEDAAALDAIFRGDDRAAVRARLALAGWSGVPAARLVLETPCTPARIAAVLDATARAATDTATAAGAEPAAERRAPQAAQNASRVQDAETRAAEPALHDATAYAPDAAAAGAALPADGRVAGPVSSQTETDAPVRVGDAVLDAATAREARERLLRTVERFHAHNPLRPGMDREGLRRALPPRAHHALADWAFDRLLAEGRLVHTAGLVATAGFVPRLSREQRLASDRILAILRDAGLAPPTVPELPPDLRDRHDFWPLLKLLEHENAVVAIQNDFFLARDILDDAVRRVREDLAGRERLTPPDFRDVVPVSRKYLIPLLEYFDRIGVTSRRGDHRAVAVASTAKK